MANIRITGLPELIRNLNDVSRRHVPFAVATALTKTARRAQSGVLDVMRARFDNPTPYAMNSLRIVSAKKSDAQPFARVYFKDDAYKGTPASKFLTPGMHGGPRSVKRFERALIGKGLMRSGQFAVPADGAQLDSYGNVRRAQIVQILSALQAFGEQGYMANRTNSRRSQRSGRASQYFAGVMDGVEGIWQRKNFGFGQGVRPVFVFTESEPQYRVRVPFEKVVENVARARLTEEFQSALDYALRTALPRN